MKILFVSYAYWPPDFGGELLISIERFESLARRGHQITVLTSGQPGFPSREERDGITILRSPVIGRRRSARLVRRMVFVFWVLYHLLRLDYNALHWLSLAGINLAGDAVMAWLWGWVAHRRGARVITVHSLADQEHQTLNLQGTRRTWKRILLSRVDHIVAVSPALLQPLAEHFPRKAVLIVNGVRDDLFTPLGQERSALRQRNEVPPEGIVFSFLGSVGRRKGFDVLAQAFAELALNHPDWRLWVIGPRSRQESQNIADQEVAEVCQPLQNYQEQVVYWGRINDRPLLAQILAASDVFVFPSRREGMGVAPLEAMAAGVPVIIARLPGITDLANVDGVTGLYVEPGNVEQLKEAMRRLGEDAELRRRMGRAARQRIVSSFGWQRYIDQWERLYMHGSVEPMDNEPGPIPER